MYRPLAAYARLRTRGLALFPPRNTIRALKLYHRQVYEYAYHCPKLALLARAQEGSPRFAALADFLERVPERCPHALFRASARASQTHAPAFVAENKRVAVRKENTATKIAALILPIVGSNYDRHARLQKFMLANDSVTVAVEIPIWLSEDDIAAIERRWSITLSQRTGNEPRVITGHIDFLQIRNGAIHILDYKPDASTNKPFAQLTIYALALSHLTGIPLFDFKCAWFNETDYCEFFPRTILARKNAILPGPVVTRWCLKKPGRPGLAPNLLRLT